MKPFNKPQERTGKARRSAPIRLGSKTIQAPFPRIAQDLPGM